MGCLNCLSHIGYIAKCNWGDHDLSYASMESFKVRKAYLTALPCVSIKAHASYSSELLPCRGNGGNQARTADC